MQKKLNQLKESINSLKKAMSYLSEKKFWIKKAFFLSKKPVVLPGSKKSIPLPGLLADLLRFYQGLKNVYLNLYSLKKLT